MENRAAKTGKRILAGILPLIPIIGVLYHYTNLGMLEGNVFTFWEAAGLCALLLVAIPAFNQLVLFKDKAFYKLHLIALSTGVLLAMSWPPMPTAFIIFFAWLPLLYAEHLVSDPDSEYYGYSFFRVTYSSMLMWNLLTTWWVGNSHVYGGLVAFVANAFLMTLPIWLFHKTKRQIGPKVGYLSLVVYYVAFEYLHMQWDLTWPWLTLGNVFARFPEVVQWYELTGHLGGSVWVLVVNVLIFSSFFSLPLMQQFFQGRFKLAPKKAMQVGATVAFSRPVLLILIPLLISIIWYTTYEEKGPTTNVTVVQPNIDPYNEKFNTSVTELLQKYFEASHKGMTDSTTYLVWPETSLPTRIWVDDPTKNSIFRQVVRFMDDHPNTTLIAGITAFERYDYKASVTARYYSDGACCYDVYNAAIQVDTSKNYPLYKKSKLVPGVERMPYPGIFQALANLAIDLGGISGSLGTQEERSVFFNKDSVGIAPAICYESVFGGYMTQYYRNGADAIFIVTNDGWWGNTAGHKQHLYYASLRAIEGRRAIARSANTGTSCFINQRGDISQATEYWVPAVITANIHLNSELTFFARYGDYIGRVCGFLTIFYVLYSFVRTRLRR